MIIGTAGHIDHGKSALVTALSGRPVDRLVEERRRGITIDLNFAPLELGTGIVAGIVDVPGHEDFVRTMVAGASGVDLALLVIAADEGVMPQTEEHLAILEHLAVPAGVPVVTKADLVEPEWLELVLAEVAERVARSSVPFEVPVPVSALTGAGLEHLRERLRLRARELPPRATDAFRLPVDRVFSVAGVGTVVTGTAWSGSVSVGDAVRLLPGDHDGRVRSIESHGRAESRSASGQRTALGIGGIERAAAHRGSVVVTRELPWSPTTALDVELALQADAPRPLAPRTRVRVLHGTAELMARVHPRQPIEPGGTGLARLALETPIVARGGDRFVIRSYSPVATIGGGRVLDPLPPRRPAAWDDLAAAELRTRALALIRRRRHGVETALLPLLTGATAEAVRQALAKESGLRSTGGRWIPVAELDAAAARALERVRAWHRAHPSDRGIPLETLRQEIGAPEWIVAATLVNLAGQRRLVLDESIARLPGFQPRIAGGDEELERILSVVDQAGLMPPSVAELETQVGRRDVAAALRLGATQGRVEAVERDRYYGRPALDRFLAALRELGPDREVVPAELRDRLGITRKYLIPLLEWSDRRGFTRRAGESRRVAGALLDSARDEPAS